MKLLVPLVLLTLTVPVRGQSFADIFITNRGALNQACLGNANGAYACNEVAGGTGALSRSVAADFNGDGFSDIAVASSVGSSTTRRNQVCLGDGLGGLSCSDIFTEADGDTGSASRAYSDVDAGDLDGDLDIDLLFADQGDRNILCLNDGTGQFSCSVFRTYTDDDDLDSDDALGIAFAHLNGDTDLDIAFANSPIDNAIYCLNRGVVGGLPQFECYAMPDPGTYNRRLAVGDFDNDGAMDDLAYANWTNSSAGVFGEANSVCINSGAAADSLAFSCLDVIDSTGSTLDNSGSNDVGAADFDGDGFVDDLVFANRVRRNDTNDGTTIGAFNRVCLNTSVVGGVPTFSCSNLSDELWISEGLDVGDLNGDLLPDIAVVNWDLGNTGEVFHQYALGNGDGTFEVTNFAQAFVPWHPVIVDLQGALTTFSQTLTGAEGWRMLASPDPSGTLDDLVGGLWTQGFEGADYNGDRPPALPNVYRYDESLGGSAEAGWVPPTSQAEETTSARGYIVYVYDDDDLDGTPEGFPKTLTFDGLPAIGPIAPTVSYTENGTTADDEGWNLFGNPFAEPIDWDLTARSGLDQTVYVWDPSVGAYLVWDGSAGSLTDGIIAPFQGFFVRAQSDAATFSIPDDAKTAGGIFAGITAAEDVGIPTLPLVLETPVGDAHAWVRMRETAELGLDETDAFALSPLAVTFAQLYTTSLGESGPDAGTSLVINALPSLAGGEAIEVPLSLRVLENSQEIGGTFTLRWPTLEQLPEGWSVILHDAETGERIDLNATDAYTFDWMVEAAEKAGSGATDATIAQDEPNRRAAASLPTELVSRLATAERFTLRITAGSAVSVEEGAVLPEVVTLAGSYPNPFDAQTTLRYGLPEAGPAQVMLYDLAGRLLQVLAEGDHAAGWHEVTLDARDLANGVYVARLSVNGVQVSHRLTLVR
ncbi:MAG: T9SS type A sorting domain-containing protein [Bacteroidota bacterium]